MNEDSRLIPCPVCSSPFKQAHGRKHCSEKCRIKAFYLREAAKIADQVREDVYKMLVERLLK